MENSMKNNDEIEIDLRQIFIVILSKIAIILLVGTDFPPRREGSYIPHFYYYPHSKFFKKQGDYYGKFNLSGACTWYRGAAVCFRPGR